MPGMPSIVRLCVIVVLACSALDTLADEGERARLLIIAPQTLIDATLDSYATGRAATIEAEIVALETLLESSDGADDPEKLKRYLYERWRDDGVRYVLLVGDADVMPVRYMVLDRVTEPAFNCAFYPSDLYYADVARADGSFDDWNAAKDDFHAGYFGEVRGEKNKSDPINFDAIDYRPEIAVGRWPVNTTEEVATVVAKSLAYVRSILERTSAEPPVVAMLACGGWIENRGMMDASAAALGGSWSIEKRYFSDGSELDAGSPPSEEEVIGLINNGTQLIFHSGHGSDNNWHESIGTYSLAKLENAEHPAILFSAGCSTARLATLPPYEGYVDVNGVEHAGTNKGEVFTAPPPPPAPYQRGAYNPTGFGEQLLRAAPNGAAAYIGCNTGSQPCGMTLLDGFVRAMGSSGAQLPPPSQGGGEGVGQVSVKAGELHPLPSPPPQGGGGSLRLGDAWNAAISHYYDAEDLATIAPNESWYPASIFFQGMKFMLFGDPSLPLPRPGAAMHADDPEPAKIDTELEAIRSAHDVPGLVATACIDGRITCEGAAGMRIAGSDVAVTTDDLFHIGSCTKAMTATLAGIMVNEGLINWKTTIAESMPELVEHMDPGFTGVTLEQLLSHRSGLSEDRSPDANLWPKIRALEGDMRARRVEFTKLVLAHPPAESPGTKMSYSNAGYVVAGAMLERAGGDSWEDLIRAKMFEPLGMASAGFGAPGASTDREAPDQPWGHRGSTAIAPGPAADNPAVLGPAGTVHCSLGDWMKFARLHLGEKVGELQLDEATLARLHTDPEGDGYTLGWGVTERGWAGGTTLTHAGSNTMWFAVVWLAPGKNAGYLAAANTGAATAPRACDEAIALMIGMGADD